MVIATLLLPFTVQGYRLVSQEGIPPLLPERIIQQPQPPTQEAHVVTLVPEQAIPAMQQAVITVLQTLPTPVTITEHKDSRDGKDYYTYRVGTISEQQPFGIAMGATPDFLDAVRFSLEAALKQSNEHREGGRDTV